jgi:hypothetical protein
VLLAMGAYALSVRKMRLGRSTVHAPVNRSGLDQSVPCTWELAHLNALDVVDQQTPTAIIV